MNKIEKRKLALKVFGKKGSKQRSKNALKAWKTRNANKRSLIAMKAVKTRNENEIFETKQAVIRRVDLSNDVKQMILEYIRSNIDTAISKIA